MVVNYNDIINAIARAEDVALYNARARAIELSNGCKPSKADDDKAIEIESWIQLLTRAAATIDQDTCLDDDIIWQIIQNVNELNRDVDCDVSRTYSRHSSSGGGSNVPSGYVERVLGAIVDNTDPSNPILRIYVDPSTMTGNGSQADPLSSIGGGGGATNLGYTASPTNGIVTSSTGTDATIPLADATNAGLLKPAKYTVLENTSGTNTGNETTSTLGVTINAATAATPNDTDLVATVDTSLLKKITWTNVKAFLKTYFDTIYTTSAAVAASYVPYTGATADVDLDIFGLDAKFVKIKGTAGDGKLGLKHQSSAATASASESIVYADASGNPKWKNDGNTVESILTNSGGSLTGAINESQGANIASATTTNIGAATGNYVVVTGTTTITGLGTVQAGTRRIVNFSGILTLTHNGTSLILPTSANITTAAGDTATFISLGSGNWVCVNYMRASGAALVGGGTDTYAVNVGSFAIAAPADATNYYFGLLMGIAAAAGDRRSFKFPTAGTVTAFSMQLDQTTNGSSQTVNIYLTNVTTATDTAIGTFTSDFGANSSLKTLFSGLSIAVNTTDDWCIKIVTPTWTTNPAQWIPNGILKITV